MAFGLSFSQEFFTGIEDYPTPSKRPTNCLQAIESLPEETKKGIAKDVLKVKGKKFIEMVIKSETFAHEVLDKLREYDTCDDLSPPIEVYINGDYSITVYAEIDPKEFQYETNKNGVLFYTTVDGTYYKLQITDPWADDEGDDAYKFDEKDCRQRFLEYIMAEIEKD
jgi:hypothetical protein